LLYLDFHHHIILVRCNERSLLQKLEEEFHFFKSKETSHSETVIELLIEDRPVIPSLVATKILETGIVYTLGSTHYVDYFGEAFTIWNKDRNSIQIFSKNTDRLYELAFLSIHSILGQKLDRDGLCRLHAVAVSLKHINAIVMLPSKGGKSTLLQNVINQDDIKIISDDMPLCDSQGRIYPFPSKLSLNEKPLEGSLASLHWHEFKRHHYPTKFTAGLSQLSGKIDHHPENNQNLLIAGFRLSSGQSILEEVPKWKMIKPLMEHMIIGIGLPQIIEMFLSFNSKDLIKLPYHAFKRSICAFNLALKARCFYFYMGPDKIHNAQLLMDLMNEHKNT
jgi:hypothetical protein